MTTKRYTEQELRNLAGLYGGELHEALKQAAEDCEDAERYRVIVEDAKVVQFADWQWEREDDYEGSPQTSLNERLDTARTQEKARSQS